MGRLSYDKIRGYFDRGLWTQTMVENAYIKGVLTEDQVSSILHPPAPDIPRMEEPQEPNDELEQDGLREEDIPANDESAPSTDETSQS